MRWIASDKYAQDAGISTSLLSEYKKSLFQKGKHFLVLGRTTWIDVHAVDELLTTLASESLEDGAKSATPMRQVSAVRSLPNSPSRLE